MLGIGAFPGETGPRLVEHPEPSVPGENQVLCRTVELGVCGTDRDILESASPLIPMGASHLVLGHECLGRVVEAGRNVRDFRAGDLVVPVVRRAFDPTRQRADMLPFGTFTERGIVEEHGFSLPLWLDEPRFLFRVPAEVAEVAVLTEPVSVAEKGIREAVAVQRGRLGDAAWNGMSPRVLVTGQGPIAFACVLACRCFGWPTTVWGRDDRQTFRSQLAGQWGAQYISASEFVSEPTDVERDGFDLILECTGSDQVTLLVANSLASCGVMVWLGSSRCPQSRDHNVDRLMRNAILRNHVHLGTVNAALEDFATALRHLAQFKQLHGAALAEVVTDRVGLADSLWHYTHRRSQGIKTVVCFDEP